MRNFERIVYLSLIAAILGGCTPKPSPDMSDSFNAFKKINQSLVQSNKMIDEKNEKVVKMIQLEQRNEPDKVNDLMGIEKQVHNKSGEILAYINGLIMEISKSGNDGDVDLVNRLLSEGEDGDSLKAKLMAYKVDIFALMIHYRLPSVVPIDEGLLNHYEPSWQVASFHNVPKIAAITILNKFCNDIKNTEAMCIDRLAKEAVATEIPLDKFWPYISAKSTILSQGETYEATIGLAATNFAVVPEILVDGKKIGVIDGKATYTALAKAKGTFTVPLIIKIPSRGLGIVEIPGELKYTVR